MKTGCLERNKAFLKEIKQLQESGAHIPNYQKICNKHHVAAPKKSIIPDLRGKEITDKLVFWYVGMVNDYFSGINRTEKPTNTSLFGESSLFDEPDKQPVVTSQLSDVSFEGLIAELRRRVPTCKITL